eukprot:scaffold48345_cov58-Phaeocystis_antarctica.AAC.5
MSIALLSQSTSVPGGCSSGVSVMGASVLSVHAGAQQRAFARGALGSVKTADRDAQAGGDCCVLCQCTVGGSQSVIMGIPHKGTKPCRTALYRKPRRHLELVPEARGCLEDGQSKYTAAHPFVDRRHSWLDRKRVRLGHRLVALGPPTGLVRVDTLDAACAKRFAVDIDRAHMLIAREVRKCHVHQPRRCSSRDSRKENVVEPYEQCGSRQQRHKTWCNLACGERTAPWHECQLAKIPKRLNLRDLGARRASLLFGALARCVGVFWVAM